MRWLVTGGAGYIGAHVVAAMLDQGYDVTVLDDLSTGHRSFVPEAARFIEGSCGDARDVDEALQDCVGVVHVAGIKYAGESVTRPLDFYYINVEGMRVLLQRVTEHGIRPFVFSSSAAVFGTPDVDLVDEDTAKAPESPYGETKLIGEWLLKDVETAQRLRDEPPLKWCALRYFNVVGSGLPNVYDTSPYNLFPLINRALSAGEAPTIRGDDYPTPDGTCVRDYIHVNDVATAHVAAARRLAEDSPLPVRYLNLGRGVGISVGEIMRTYQEVTGDAFEYKIGPRRPGDPARIVTRSDRANNLLNWSATGDLTEMVASSWRTWPRDYKD